MNPSKFNDSDLVMSYTENARQYKSNKLKRCF